MESSASPKQEQSADQDDQDRIKSGEGDDDDGRNESEAKHNQEMQQSSSKQETDNTQMTLNSDMSHESQSNRESANPTVSEERTENESLCENSDSLRDDKSDQCQDGVKTEPAERREISEELQVAGQSNTSLEKEKSTLADSVKSEKEAFMNGQTEAEHDPYNFSEEDFGPAPRQNPTRIAASNGRRDLKFGNHPSFDLGDFEDDDDEDEEMLSDNDEFSDSKINTSERSYGDEDRLVIAEDDASLSKPLEHFSNNTKVEKKRRKRQDRFNGMSEEEVAKLLLPDLIKEGLDILIIGINPSMYGAFKGHHYAGPGNHFWKCMFLSGLIPHPMSAEDDAKLLNIGIGFTNIVERTTKGSANLTRQEIVEGTQILLEKIKRFQPKIAVFNGKGIYEVFSGKKDFHFGKQPDVIEDTQTHVWVMPNSSARCAQLPRAVDKVPFFEALRKFRDHITGKITMDEQEIEKELIFSDIKLKNFNEPSPQKKLAAIMDNSNSSNSSDMFKNQFAQSGNGDPSMHSQAMSDSTNYMVNYDQNNRALTPNPVDPITGKKRRGRPPKPRPDGTIPPPKRRAYDAEGNPIPRGSNPIDPLTGKKKRGRPKKSDLPPGAAPPTYRKKQKKSSEQVTSVSSVPPTDVMSNQMNPLGASVGAGESQGLPTGPTGSIANMNNKPTKVVPPLPPFSPHFGHESLGGPMGKEEEKPVDLKSQNNDSTFNQQQQHHEQLQPQQHQSSSHHPCEFPGRPSSQPDHHANYNRGSQQNNIGSYHYPNANAANLNSSGYQPRGNLGNNSNNFSHPHPLPPKSEDVSTKSITGLESLVEQIPAMAENDSGIFSGSAGGSSHPTTPRSVGPYSPAAGAASHSQYQSPFHPPIPAGSGGFGGNPYLPSTSSSAITSSADSMLSMDHSTNHNQSTSTSSAVSSCPTDFSVNSLVHTNSTVTTSTTAADHVAAAAAAAAAVAAADPFNMSNLTSADAATMAAAASKYPGLSGNPYGMFHHTTTGSSFGAGGFLSGHNSFPAGHPMSAMAMGHHMGAMAAGMPYYGQYSANNPYGGAASTSGAFAASAYSHGLPMPNPSYPYPSPYGQSPYSQSPYF